MQIDEYRFNAFPERRRSIDANFRFIAFSNGGLRSRLWPSAQQDIFVMRLHDRLSQLALPEFLPLVIAKYADHRRRTQANQSHLEFGHLNLFPGAP